MKKIICCSVSGFDLSRNFQMAVERVHVVETGRSLRAGHLEPEQARGM